MNKFYLTTPIYYVNDAPHIGHAYTTIAADILARYWRQKLGKENVFFLTGTDEHGAKIAQAAKDNELNPKEFVDSIVPKFQESWKLLNVTYDHFSRTTDPRHETEVQKIIQKIYDKNLIYEDIYKGLYCEGCEAFLTDNDLSNEKCPLHPNKVPQHQEEKNFFFKLSAFKNELIHLFESNIVQIDPPNRKQEILGKLKLGLKDISFSRAGVKWGISIPWDTKQTIYVWFEALLNYYTATKFAKDKEKFWPADLHIIGKDILWFHTVIWNAILLAAELPLPKKIFAHGFFTIDGQKISKSLGNTISPEDLVEKYGVDGSRYLLLSAFSFGQDGDFSFNKLTAKYNSDLANGLGNLVSRVAKLCEQNNIEIESKEQDFDSKFEEALTQLKFDQAIDHISEEIAAANKKVNDDKPWELKGETARKVLINLVDAIRHIAFNLQPFTPSISEKILNIFSGKIKNAESLFPRIS